MSKRNQRREAERAARKTAYQQLRQQRAQGVILAASELTGTGNTEVLLAKAQAFFETGAPSAVVHSELPETSAETAGQPAASDEPALLPKQVSAAQLVANRANAQFSTGATTPEGKARSSLNALKHALTGKTVLLPGEDPAAYQREFDDSIRHYQPATEEELRLVQSLLNCIWRIDRVQRLQTSVLLKGHIEFAAKYADRSPFERSHLIEAEAYVKYEKQICNLTLQEGRLRRNMEKDRLELSRLQTIRRQQERSETQDAHHEPTIQKAAAPHENGFEFSTAVSSRPAQSNHPGQRRKQAA